MSAREPEGVRERPKFLTAGMIALVAVMILCILLPVLRLTLISSARRALEFEIAEARDRGYPTTPEELAPPPVPEEENSAPLLEAAGAMASKDGRYPEYGQWFDRYDRRGNSKEMKAALEKHAAALEKAREALKKAQYRFERSYGPIPDFTVPDLAGPRTMVNLMNADSMVRAREGKRQEALEALSDALEVGTRIGTDPLEMSKMIGVALVACVPAVVEQMEREGLLDDDMRRLIIDRFGREDILPRADTLFLEGLAFTPTFAADLFGDQRLWGGGPGGVAYNKTFVRLFQFVYLNDFALTVRSLREATDAARLPPWEFLRELEAISARMNSISEWKRPLSRPLGGGSSGYSDEPVFATRAKLDAARVGLALELHRSARGDYPDTLDALAPAFLAELPKDLYTGKDLIYRRAGDDVTVSSVGRDLKYGPEDDASLAWKTKRPPPPPPRKRRSRKKGSTRRRPEQRGESGSESEAKPETKAALEAE